MYLSDANRASFNEEFVGKIDLRLIHKLINCSTLN